MNVFRGVVPYRIRCVCQEMPESETKCTTTQPGRTLVRRKLDETSPAGSKSERPVRAYLGQIYRWLDRRTQVAKFTKSRSMEVLISNVYKDKIYTTGCPRKNTEISGLGPYCQFCSIVSERYFSLDALFKWDIS